MVRSKAPPRHAEVRSLKCIVYMTRNPVTFEIHRRHEYYLLDQRAQETKYQAEYKRHVQMPPAPPAITTPTMDVTNC